VRIVGVVGLVHSVAERLGQRGTGNTHRGHIERLRVVAIPRCTKSLPLLSAAGLT
jgi:hypothetical protein